MLTIDQILAAQENGTITLHEATRKLRQRLQALSAPRGLSVSEYEEAFQDYSGYVLRVLSCSGCPPDMLEDAAQDAWLKVWTKRHLFDPKRGSLATFISRIAKSVLSDRRAKLSAMPELISLHEPVGDNALQDESLAVAGAASESDLRFDLTAHVLTPGDLSILPLLEAGLTASEIATRLNTKPKTIKNRLQSLRRRVRKYLGWHPVNNSHLAVYINRRSRRD